LKDVKLDVSYLKKRKEDFANAWTNSLSHQIKKLPDFEYAYKEVIRNLKLY